MNSESSDASSPQRPHDAAASKNRASENTASEHAASENAGSDQVAPESTDSGVPENDRPATPVAPTPTDAAPDQTPSPAQKSGQIQIGSRRNRDQQGPMPSKPQTPKAKAIVQSQGPPKPSGPVPVPSVRAPLSADLEAEIAAALGDSTLDEVMAGGVDSSDAGTVEVDARLMATVVRVHGDNIFFALSGRNEGVASSRQFREPPAVGAQLEVVVKSYNADEGLYELAVPGASTQVGDWTDVAEGTTVEARITGANTGGLECQVGGLRGFIPASQVAIYRVEDFSEYVDQKLTCVVTEVNPQRKNLVLSHRAVLEREQEEAREKLMESLEPGQTKEGVVRKIMDFGAFVDIGGVDGLVHISQLSWDRVAHPSEVLQEGQQVQVKIEKIDRQTGKIGLSYRELTEHPWKKVDQEFPVDSVVTGTVSRVANFGAFVKLAPGIEGLVHISELAHGRVPNVNSVVSEGQQVDVKVLSVDPQAQRMSLSIKAVLPDQAQEVDEDPAEAERVHQEAKEKLLAKRTKPLKGGMGRDTGGDQFGLKW